MKKILALILALITLLSFAACGEKKAKPKEKFPAAADTVDVAEPKVEFVEEKEPENNPEITAYLKDQGKAMLASLESTFADSTNRSCQASARADGNGLVIDIYVDGFVDLDQSTKNNIQASYDSMQEVFDALFEEMKKDITDALEFVTISVREETGTIIATVKMGEK